MVSFQNDIEKCLGIINSGGLILYPTDTVWGIGCDALNPLAIDIIYKLKKRSDKKAMILLVEEDKEIAKYVHKPANKIADYLKTVARPTTVIYANAKNLPSNIISEDGSIAIRLVQDEFCKTLLHHFQKPIVATSANISGTDTPKNFSEISKEIKNGVDYIVQHRRDDSRFYEPSSIIRLKENGEIEMIR